MKYYTFDDAFRKEPVENLVTFLNNNEHEEITIYLYTVGGTLSLGVFLADIINSRKPLTRIFIADEIHSTGFIFLFLLHRKVDIIISNMVCPYSIIHLCNKDIGSRSADKETALESVNLTNEKLISYFSSFLTPKELRLFKKGEDIMLNNFRLKKILQDDKGRNKS